MVRQNHIPLVSIKTINKSVKELGKTFDERIASRLLQARQVVKLTGGDKRHKGTKQISGEGICTLHAER